MIVSATEFMIENILPVAGHPFHQSILRLRFDCARLRSTFVDVAWHLRRIPKKKKRRPRIKRGEWRDKEEILLGNHRAPGSGTVCEKVSGSRCLRVRRDENLALVFITWKTPATPILRWPQINQWREDATSLPKKIWVERFLLDIVYRFIRNLSSRRTLKIHWQDTM